MEQKISNSSFGIAFESVTNAVIIATGVFHNTCRLNSIADVPPEVEIPTVEVVPVPNTAEEPDYTERATLILNFFNKCVITICIMLD